MNTKIQTFSLVSVFSSARQWVSRHRQFAVLVAVLVAAGALTYVVLRTSLPVKVAYQAQGIAVDAPLELEISQNLREIPVSDIATTPETKGRWEHRSGKLVGDDKLVFYPDEHMKVATTYEVSFPDATRVFGGASEIPEVTFATETAPGLKDTGLMSLKKGDVIAADYAPTVSLKSKNRGLRALELRMKPAIAMELRSENDQTFSWQPKKQLPQGKTIEVELVDTKNDVSLAKMSLKVADEPAIKDTVKAKYFTPRDKATIVFATPIKPDQQKYIVFGVEGEGTWKNDTTYEFTPKNIEPGKTYSYTVKKGFRSSEGGILTRDLKHSFATTGPVTVSGMSPWGNGLAQARQTLKFTFDQAVDQPSAVNSLQLSHGKLVGTSWQGNTLIATVKDLGFQQQVTATIATGVKNAGFGAPSNRPFSLTFSTEARTVRLDVPYYRQQHEATCTAAALRMVLGYRGISAGEMDIVQKMGYQPRSMDKSKNPPVWDDPNQMFVGSVDGYIRGGTGAGPDAPPVAKAARSYGRSASVARGISANWIAQQIHAGHPVIMFGSTLNTGNISWETPSGGTATMNLTGHVTVVTGVVGEPHAPLGFYVHDPYRTSSYWSTGEVAANIARDPYGQAVVVY
jgi:uncharacterized protein YvpB